MIDVGTLPCFAWQRDPASERIVVSRKGAKPQRKTRTSKLREIWFSLGGFAPLREALLIGFAVIASSFEADCFLTQSLPRKAGEFIAVR